LDDVALGFGDVNLSGILGLMLGWPLILTGLVLAIFVGGLVSLIYLLIMMILRRYQLFTALPYGPFLITGAFVMLFFGGSLLAILGY
jgi:leader peptidase (prepilin peptidase)/N-methyltransferase